MQKTISNKTRILKEWIQKVFDELAVKARTPLGRGQTPEDIGKTVAFFASEDSSEITGQALNVNGGASLN